MTEVFQFLFNNLHLDKMQRHIDLLLQRLKQANEVLNDENVNKKFACIVSSKLFIMIFSCKNLLITGCR